MWPLLASCNYHKGGCGSISIYSRSVAADMLGMHVMLWLTFDTCTPCTKIALVFSFWGRKSPPQGPEVRPYYIWILLWLLRSANDEDDAQELRTFHVEKEKEVDSQARGGSTRPAPVNRALGTSILSVITLESSQTATITVLYRVYLCSLYSVDLSLHGDYSSGSNNLYLCSLALLKHNPILIPGI